MPLTHVSMWTDNGFMPVTAEQVTNMPGCRNTVSAKSGLFLCRLCNQYVAFSSAHYFMHSSGYEDKECPERLVGFYESIETKVKQRALPIRLSVIDSRSVSISIGIALPSGVNTDQGILTIESKESKRTYPYNIRRLTAGDIEYLSLQQDLSPIYKLCLDEKAAERLVNLIPEEIKGVSGEGTLFRVLGNGRTGKKVLHGTNVHVNTKYFLVTQHRLPSPDPTQRSLSCIQICRSQIGYHTWYVYEVNAFRYDEITRRFFLEYRFILSESMEKLVAVWPVHCSSPYVTYHDNNKIWFYLHGEDIAAHSFPFSHIDSYRIGNDEEQVLRVYCTGRQQTLLAGKSKVLRYTYLWRDPERLSINIKQPAIIVTDLNGEPMRSGETTQLPFKRCLRIHAPFDGRILIRKNGQLMEKQLLKSEHPVELYQIGYGMEIQVFQGLDSVWSIHFRVGDAFSDDDEKIYQQLCQCHRPSVPFPHRFGALFQFTNDMPKVSQWVRMRILIGNIPEDALLILKKIVKEKRDNNDRL